jgi:carboxyl-terminal processing protease
MRLDHVRRSCWIVGLALLAVLGLAAAQPSVFAANEPSSDHSSHALSPAMFGEMLTGLKAAHAETDPRLARLIADIERFEAHQQRDRQQRVEACAKAVDEMVAQAQESKLKEALASAVNAHGHALDTAALLNDPRLTGVVHQAEQAAQDAATDGDWLEVLALYRRLNLLYEPASPYREKQDQAEQRVRIIGLYAPDYLRGLHIERAKANGEPVPEIDPIEFDSWQKVLKGVTREMLHETITGADHHVTSPQRADLLIGAIDQLRLMIDMEELAVTFPSLDKPHKVAAFRTALLDIRREAQNRRDRMFASRVDRLIDRIMGANAQSLGLPAQVVIYELAEGAVGTLDKFSEVIWPYKLEQFQRSMHGDFTGVGISIAMTEDNQIKVITPIMNTPAHLAGIKSNDIIVKVDGADTSYWTLDRAVRNITGPKGTHVTLTITRAGVDEPIEYVLTRDRIPLESIAGWERREDNSWSFYIDRENRIGYIRLTQFLPQSADDLDAAITAMRDDNGLDAVILDLRFNPGGLLSQAVEVTNRFLPSGTVVSTVGPDDMQTSSFRAWPHKANPNLDVVVLINRGSASASEIVAGALQDYGRATIVGTRSYGKGSVQDLYPFDENNDGVPEMVLKLTTQYYKLPAGRIIHRKPGDQVWGVDPDMLVEMTDQQTVEALEIRQKIDILRDPEVQDPDHPRPHAVQMIDEGTDPQLETALLLLKTRLLADRIKLAQGE